MDAPTLFIKRAMRDLRRAAEMLAEDPALARANFHTALVFGDAQEMGRALDAGESASAPGGPLNVPPLIYVCFSRFADRTSARAGNFVAAARLLVAHGADANTSYVDERWADFPLPCLYGATGLNNNPQLARALLDAGASPNDNESLYHSTEHADLECMRLLLERGAPTRRSTLWHMLDREDPEGVRLLQAAGADPNLTNPRGDTALHWAVWRGRSARIVEILLDAGVAIDARREDGRTAYALAFRSGQTETAALLEGRGADTELNAFDRQLGELALAGAAKPAELPEEYSTLLPDFAQSHRTAVVRGLLAAGVPPDSLGKDGCTALHWACWKGYPDLVTLLLKHGARLDIKDTGFNATPAGWFLHGLFNSIERDGDYPLVARLLLDAGARFNREELPTGVAAVDAVLLGA